MGGATAPLGAHPSLLGSQVATMGEMSVEMSAFDGCVFAGASLHMSGFTEVRRCRQSPWPRGEMGSDVHTGWHPLQ